MGLNSSAGLVIVLSRKSLGRTRRFAKLRAGLNSRLKAGKEPYGNYNLNKSETCLGKAKKKIASTHGKVSSSGNFDSVGTRKTRNMMLPATLWELKPPK